MLARLIFSAVGSNVIKKRILQLDITYMRKATT